MNQKKGKKKRTDFEPKELYRILFAEKQAEEYEHED